MNLILLPKFSENNNVRVWVGAFFKTKAPKLTWKIEPVSISTPSPNQIPLAIKEIKSVRPNELLKGNSDRTFSGIYEFENCEPDKHYKVLVSADTGESQELRVKTLPNEIPSDKYFNIMLISCYYYETDKQGFISDLLYRIPPELKPDLTFLMGDQVYLDLPTFKDFLEDAVWLAEKFEKDYIRNWRGISNGYLKGYPKILSIAPTISLPDDHEFWNNYPHVSPIIQNSFSSSGRENWKNAALAMYEGFQKHNVTSSGESEIINIEPLSFFIADTRTNRDFNLNYSLKKTELTKMSDWIKRLEEKNYFGIFVSGQSIFQKKVDWIGGKLADYELINYGDYKSITDLLKSIANSGLQITCLTGDVHWGRIGFIIRIDKVNPDFTEIISSPSSLVSNPIDDVKSFFQNIINKNEPWPKHSNGERINGLNNVEFNSYKKLNLHMQKGNHVGILSFKKTGYGIERTMNYFPIHWDMKIFNEYKYKNELTKLIKI